MPLSKQEYVDVYKRHAVNKDFRPGVEKRAEALAERLALQGPSEIYNNPDYDLDRKIKEEFLREYIEQMDPRAYAKTLQLYRNKNYAEYAANVSQAVSKHFGDKISDAEKKRIVWYLLHESSGYSNSTLTPEFLDKVKELDITPKGAKEKKSVADYSNYLKHLRDIDQRSVQDAEKLEPYLKYINDQRNDYEKKVKDFDTKYKNSHFAFKHPTYEAYIEAIKKGVPVGHTAIKDKKNFEKEYLNYSYDIDDLERDLHLVNEFNDTFVTNQEYLKKTIEKKFLAEQLEEAANRFTELTQEKEELEKKLQEGVDCSDELNRINTEHALTTEALENLFDHDELRIAEENKNRVPFLQNTLDAFQKRHQKDTKSYEEIESRLNELIAEKVNNRKESGLQMQALIDKQIDYLQNKYLDFANKIDHPSSVFEASRLGGKDYAKTLSTIKKFKAQSTKKEFQNAITPWVMKLTQDAHDRKREDLADEIGLLDNKAAHRLNVNRRNVDNANQLIYLHDVYAKEKEKLRLAQENLLTTSDIAEAKRKHQMLEEEYANNIDGRKTEQLKRAYELSKNNLSEQMTNFEQKMGHIHDSQANEYRYNANKLAADGRQADYLKNYLHMQGVTAMGAALPGQFHR